MAQNIYDEVSFFKAYSALPRSSKGLSAAPEWPTLRSIIGPVSQKRVLDLGSGFGYFVQWARENGAESVHGIDLSENMLYAARELAPNSEEQGVTWERADLEDVILEKDNFDLVFSSLTLHYLVDLKRILEELWQSLIPGGKFVFSVEHPIYTAPRNPGFREVAVPEYPEAKSSREGEKSSKTEVIWPLNAYADEGLRTTNWLAPGFQKQHRTLSTWLTALLDVGFETKAIREWMPTSEILEKHPEWKGERDRPMFLLVGAEKRVK